VRHRILGVLPWTVGAAMVLGPAPARAQEGRVAPLSVGDPARPLALRARLAVEVRPGEGATPPSPDELPPSEWRATGPSWIKESAGSGWSAVLRATPDRRGVTLEAEIHYSAPMVVTREAIALRLPGRARALGRDLRVAPLGRTLRVDRGTPVWMATSPDRKRPGAAVVGEQGIAAARYSPRGGDTDVELIVDDAASHPFRAYASCRSAYLPHLPGERAPRHPPPEMEVRVPRDRITRTAGEVVRARAQIYLVDGGHDFAPVIVERWARGARAAVVFTDHADRTDPQALTALLHGVSDRSAPGFGRGGFFGHRLKITKTFFLRPGLGTLEDPDARQLADELAAHGSEVGSHSITPRRDLRAEVMASIGGYAAWKAVTWIDHQPDTNCEAIASRGWRDDPSYGIHDVLAAAGFRWVWSASDVPLHTVRVRNVFDPERAAAALPPIYPLPSDPRLWVFESSWFYGPIARMAAAFSDADLDQLEDERGLFVAHTYLSASPRTTRRRDLIGRDAVVPRLEGGFALDPGLEVALARLGERAARGTIASLTLRESSDRLRQLGAVVLRYREDGSVLVSNVGSTVIEGLTLAIPAAVDPVVEGAPIGGIRSEAERTTLWLDLAGGATVVVTARAPAVPGGWPAQPGAHQETAVPLGAGAPARPGGALP